MHFLLLHIDWRRYLLAPRPRQRSPPAFRKEGGAPYYYRWPDYVRQAYNGGVPKLGAEIARLGFVEADVTEVFWIRRSDIEVLVEKTLRSIRVCVDHEGGVVNLASFRADCLSLGTDQESDENGKNRQ